MTVVFIGTAAFAVPSLLALHGAGHTIRLVISQPDRPGHRRRPAPPPVKLAAERLGLPVLQPERIREPSAVEPVRAASPELVVVVAYGQIIPPALLELPPRGVLNVHASLLPRWRGAAPVAHAILAGDRMTGVTIMRMDERLDHGPILSQAQTEIGPHEDAGELGARLAGIGARLLVDTISRLDAIEPVKQDHSSATMAPRLSRGDGELSWEIDAGEIDRRVRAFQPWPGVTLPVAGNRVKVLRGHPGQGAGSPGVVLRADREGVEIACAGGSYVMQEVQIPGRKPMHPRALVTARGG